MWRGSDAVVGVSREIHLSPSHAAPLMVRKGLLRGQWVRRWGVVVGQQLLLFADAEAPSPLTTIPLHNTHIARATSDATGDVEGGWLEVRKVAGGGLLLAFGEVEGESREEWLDALHEASYETLLLRVRELRDEVDSLTQQSTINQQLLHEATQQCSELRESLERATLQLKQEVVRRESLEREHSVEVQAIFQRSAAQHSVLEERVAALQGDLTATQRALAKARADREDAVQQTEEAERGGRETALRTLQAQQAATARSEHAKLASSPQPSSVPDAPAIRETPPLTANAEIATQGGRSDEEGQSEHTLATHPDTDSAPQTNGDSSDMAKSHGSRAGYLRKRGQRGPMVMWRSVWCVVADGVLAYYDSPKDVAQGRGREVPLEDAVAMESSRPHPHRDPGTVIEVHIPPPAPASGSAGRESGRWASRQSGEQSRILLFAAESHGELVEWVTAIHQSRCNLIKAVTARVEEQLSGAEYKLEVKAREVEFLSSEVHRLKWQLSAT